MKTLITGVAAVIAAFALANCNNSGATSNVYEYKVVPLGEIDRMVYAALEKQGSAEKLDGGQWKIKDLDAAKSENIMPLVLNEIGKDGWQLAGINSSQLYIFSRPAR